MLQRILGLLLHLGPLQGYKTIIGAVLNLVSLLLPAQYAPILDEVSKFLMLLGLTSKTADKSGIVPARSKVAFPVE